MTKKVQDIIDRLKNRKSDSVWDIIDAIGWGRDTTDYAAINKALREVFSDEAVDAIGTNVRALASKVYKRAEQAESGKDNFFGFSDDGWSDATNHIVGLGKATYDNFMEDPNMVLAVLRKSDEYWNVENFAYSFHV